MKTLLILRHAKTQSDAPAGIARELTEQGHRNAAADGAYIHNLPRPRTRSSPRTRRGHLDSGSRSGGRRTSPLR